MDLPPRNPEPMEDEEEENIVGGDFITPQIILNSINQIENQDESDIATSSKKETMDIDQAIEQCKTVRNTESLSFQPHSLLPMSKRGVRRQYKELLSSAFNFFIDKKFDEAIPIYMEAIRKNPNDDLPYLQLGIMYDSKGMYQKSLECRLIGSMLKGKYQNFKDCYDFALRHHYYDSAKYCLNRLIRKNPTRGLVLDKADLWMDQFFPKCKKKSERNSNLREIMKLLKDLLTKDQEDVEVLKKISFIYVEGYNSFEKAIPFLEKAVNISLQNFERQHSNPNSQYVFDFGLLNELNEAYIHCKSFSKCIQIIKLSSKKISLNLDSFPIQILINYAISYISLGNFDDAKLVVQSLLDRCKSGSEEVTGEHIITNTEFFMEISLAYFNQKQVDASTQILTKLWNAHNEIRNDDEEDGEDEDEEDFFSENRRRERISNQEQEQEMDDSTAYLHNQRIEIAKLLGRNTFEMKEYERSLKFFKVVLKDILRKPIPRRKKDQEDLEKEIVSLRLKVSGIYQKLGQPNQALLVLPQTSSSSSSSHSIHHHRHQHRTPLPPFPSGPEVSSFVEDDDEEEDHMVDEDEDGNKRKKKKKRKTSSSISEKKKRKRRGSSINNDHRSMRRPMMKIDNLIRTKYQQCKVFSSQGDTQLFLQTARPFINSMIQIGKEIGSRRRQRSRSSRTTTTKKKKIKPRVDKMDISSDDITIINNSQSTYEEEEEEEEEETWSFFNCKNVIGEENWTEFTFLVLYHLKESNNFLDVNDISSQCLSHSSRILQIKQRKKSTLEIDNNNINNSQQQQQLQQALISKETENKRRIKRRNEYRRRMIVFAISSSIHLKKYDEALSHIRDLLRERKRIIKRNEVEEKESIDEIIDRILLWNQYNLIKSNEQDKQHSGLTSSRSTARRFLKELDDYPSNLVLGNFHMSCGSENIAIPLFKKCMQRYTDEFGENGNVVNDDDYLMKKDPTLYLSTACAFLNNSQKKGVESKEWAILQAFVYFNKYKQICNDQQEKSFNLARAYHQLGMYSEAIILYEEVLSKDQIKFINMSSNEDGRNRVRVDLQREAAYNLSRIYRETGNFKMERKTLFDHIVI